MLALGTEEDIIRSISCIANRSLWAKLALVGSLLTHLFDLDWIIKRIRNNTKNGMDYKMEEIASLLTRFSFKKRVSSPILQRLITLFNTAVVLKVLNA